jgi:hypothetical protein
MTHHDYMCVDCALYRSCKSSLPAAFCTTGNFISVPQEEIDARIVQHEKDWADIWATRDMVDPRHYLIFQLNP